MTGGRSRPGAPAFLVQVKERQSQFTGLQTREAADLPPASQGPLEDVHGTAVPFPCLCEDTCRRAPHRLGTERPHHGSEGTGLRGGAGTLEHGCPRKHPRVPLVSPGGATAHTSEGRGAGPLKARPVPPRERGEHTGSAKDADACQDACGFSSGTRTPRQRIGKREFTY